jgi:hypothetical protein
MILNLSAKLAQRLKVTSNRQPQSEPLPLEEWYAHIFFAANKPYILTSEADSKFTAIIEAKGLKGVEHYSDSLLIEIMDLTKRYGLKERLSQIVESKANGLIVQRTTNKSAIAHLNHMIYHAEHQIVDKGCSTIEAAIFLNEMPINAIDFFFPVERFAGKKVKKQIRW